MEGDVSTDGSLPHRRPALLPAMWKQEPKQKFADALIFSASRTAGVI
jgi:hypothetical protein